MSRTLFILNDPPYATERRFNGLRLAGELAKREGEEVRVFLMGDAAACAKAGQRVPNGYYSIERMLGSVSRRGGEVGVCGTCMDARGIADGELAPGTRRSALSELGDWTLRANGYSSSEPPHRGKPPMTEQIVHSILLAFHNIALVGCAAAPFYNRALVLKRAQYGPKLHYELDRVVEDTLQGNAPYCIAFIVTLWVTGLGMPLNHYLFAGAPREMHAAALVALAVKLLAIGGMMAIMYVIFARLNPRLRALFAGFAPGVAPDPGQDKEFFEKRARRKALCETCLKFAVVVLVASAFLGFGG